MLIENGFTQSESRKVITLLLLFERILTGQQSKQQSVQMPRIFFVTLHSKGVYILLCFIIYIYFFSVSSIKFNSTALDACK